MVLRVVLTSAVSVLALALLVEAAEARGGSRGGSVAMRSTAAARAATPQAPSAASPSPAASNLYAGVPARSIVLPPIPTATGLTPAAPTPQSAVATPGPAFTPIAPSSPPLSTTTQSGGMPMQRNDALPSPFPASASNSQNAVSTAGGGGKTLQDCIRFWEPATHMSKGEWRASCARSVAAFPTVIR